MSAELFNHYKPDPETYRGAARLLDIETSELMLVAAHASDLRAARAQGLRTAYLLRSQEFGEHQPAETCDPDEFDRVAQDFSDLADQLGL